MPASTLRWQSFNQKKPYFVATVMALVLTVAAVGWLYGRSANVKLNELQAVKRETEPLKQKEVQFKRAYRELEETRSQLDTLSSWIEARFYWADVFSELRRALIVVEEAGRRKFGVEVGVWIEEIDSMGSASAGAGLFGADPVNPYGGGGPEYGASTAPNPYTANPGSRYGGPPEVDYPGEFSRYAQPPVMDPGMQAPGAYPPGAGAYPEGDPYGASGGGIDPMTGQPLGGGEALQPVLDPATGEPMIDPMTGQPMMAPATDGTANQAARVTLTCRAVSLTAINSAANTDLAFAVENALRASPMFDPKATSLQGQIGADDQDGTYTFGVNLVLKKPLEF
jgi:hypothetical protein